MKRTAVLLMLLCMLSVTASAAYVPEDMVSENRDGRQLIIKTYTLPPDADPGELIEEPFELEGYTYHHLETVKEEQAFKDAKAQTEVVTLETNTNDLAKILEQLAPTMEYSKDGFSGMLTLDHMWTAANRIIVDVYNKIAGISTVLAGLMSAVAVIGAKVSNNQHKTDQAWDWLKRIWIAWAIINGMGAFLAYIGPLFEGLATLQ